MKILNNKAGDTERGSGAVQSLGYFFVLVVLFYALISGGVIMQAKHRAQAGVDLGAIAGAQAISRGETAKSACAYARAIVSENHAEILSCEVDGEQVSVYAQSQPALSALPALYAHAVAAPDDY
ncbi:MAG: flp pilus-assembly TadE/G-like family protein [Actinomycetaceae bacterium]|nr:flp pilus-assembly TadE/G-like family protein [Actinomycetaceae bacterium]